VTARDQLDYFGARDCPDLQRLVGIFGGYNLIPPEAWQQFDADVAAYQKLLRAHTPVTPSLPAVTSNPFKLYPASEECCPCYRRGIIGFRTETKLRRRDADSGTMTMSSRGSRQSTAT
jgi:hypothetical protein